MNEPKPSGCFLASRWCRLFATAIDALLVPGLTLFLVMLTGVVEHAEDFVDRWWVFHVLLLAIASYLLLNGYLLWRRGQTLGKALLGIAVIHAPADLTCPPDGTFEFVPAAFWKLVCIRALSFRCCLLASFLTSRSCHCWTSCLYLAASAGVYTTGSQVHWLFGCRDDSIFWGINEKDVCDTACPESVV